MKNFNWSVFFQYIKGFYTHLHYYTRKTASRLAVRLAHRIGF